MAAQEASPSLLKSATSAELKNPLKTELENAYALNALAADPLELVAASTAADKKPKQDVNRNFLNRYPLYLQFFLGYQGLRSHEYVLGDDGKGNSRGHKSELIWNSFKNVLFGLGFGKSSPKFQFYLQVTTSLSLLGEALGNDFIYDYDWEYSDGATKDAPSHYSRHDLVQNIMLESLMRMGFPLFYSQRSLIHLGPGLSFSFTHWDAFDGAQRYYIDGDSNPVTGKIFTYGIWLLAPQIYFQFTQQFPPFLEMRLSLAYSPFTAWLDRDNHYLRRWVFYDYGFLGQQIFGDIQFTFWFSKRNLGLVLGLSGRYLFETQGRTELYDADADGKPLDRLSALSLSAGVEQGSFQIYTGIVLSFSSSKKKKSALSPTSQPVPKSGQ